MHRFTDDRLINGSVEFFTPIKKTKLNIGLEKVEGTPAAITVVKEHKQALDYSFRRQEVCKRHSLIPSRLSESVGADVESGSENLPTPKKRKICPRCRNNRPVRLYFNSPEDSGGMDLGRIYMYLETFNRVMHNN